MAFGGDNWGRVQQNALEDLRRQALLKPITDFLNRTVDQYQRENIPITSGARIDSLAYQDKLYKPEEVARDMAEVNSLKNRWRQEAQARGEKASDEFDKTLKQGERLELLKTVLFQKHLGRDFVVVRASEYDDIKNGVDNVVVDRRNGKAVCALDEVGEESGPRYNAKLNNIFQKNSRGGAELKYGFSLDASGKVILKRIQKIPIFYLARSPEKLESALQLFKDLNDDNNTFRDFVRSIIEQITALSSMEGISDEAGQHIVEFGMGLQKYL